MVEERDEEKAAAFSSVMGPSELRSITEEISYYT